MRLSEVINLPPTITTQVVDVIQHQCQPLISKLGGIDKVFKYPMYRGISNPDRLTKLADNLYSNVGYRDDRQPKDSSIIVHNALNKAFVNKFGVKYRNCVFTTSVRHIAIGYGKVYQIFPIGEFKFCWSPEINDLYYSFEDVDPNDISDEFINDIVNTYQETNLKAAIQSKHEIMLYCDNYLLIEQYR